MITLQISVENLDYQELANFATSNIDNPALNAVIKPLIGAIKLVPQDSKDKLVAAAINKGKDKIIDVAEHESAKRGIRVNIKDISAKA